MHLILLCFRLANQSIFTFAASVGKPAAGRTTIACLTASVFAVGLRPIEQRTIATAKRIAATARIATIVATA